MSDSSILSRKDWEVATLGEVLKFKSGEFLNAASMDSSGKYPVYGGNGINGYHSKFLFEDRKIVIGRVGVYCGAVHFTEPCSWITDNALYVAEKDSRLSDEYLVLSLRFANLNQYASQSGQPLISASKINDVKIVIPPLTEQKRIASLLARADRLRHLRRTAHELGESLLQSVFLEMFGDLTINQKHWDLSFLEDIADVHGGIQVTSTRNSMKLQKPYLRVANVYRNQLDLSEIKMIGLTQSEFERTKLKKDDLLFVEGHGNINEIGRAAVWDGSIEDCVHQNHLICARLDLKLANPIFVSTYVNSPAGKSYFTNISNTTSGLNTISTNTVRSCPIPLPPLSLQEEFAGVVARVESLRGRMSEAGRQVEGLFESLLAESFAQ